MVSNIAVVVGFMVVVVTVVGFVDGSRVVVVSLIVTVVGGVVPVMFARVCVMGPIDVEKTSVDSLVICDVVSVITGKVAVTGSRDVLTVVSSVVKTP